jgi:hypothetical protein
MEYLAHDGQILHKIYINKDFIDIQDTRYPVNKVSLFTENEGKLQTESNIIRYTKGSLYLYDTKHNLLRVYLFSKKYSKEPPIEFSVQSQENNGVFQNRFSLKPGTLIELYYNNESDSYYIKNTNNSVTVFSNVINVYKVGESTVYITEKNDKLTVSKKYKCTYNGCPVGKYPN